VSFDLLLHVLGEIVTRVIVKCDVRAFASEDLTDRRSDPPRTARDERTFSFK
jgi:hypothetical protein